VVKSEEGSKQAIELAVARKWRKHWSNKGHSTSCAPTLRCGSRAQMDT